MPLLHELGYSYICYLDHHVLPTYISSSSHIEDPTWMQNMPLLQNWDNLTSATHWLMFHHIIICKIGIISAEHKFTLLNIFSKSNVRFSSKTNMYPIIFNPQIYWWWIPHACFLDICIIAYPSNYRPFSVYLNKSSSYQLIRSYWGLHFYRYAYILM